jgi:hypothetical protein
MKATLYLVILAILTNHSLKSYCQEEFYGNHNGLTLAYLQGFNAKANAVGFSTYFKKDLILGVGLETVNNMVFPTFSLFICPSWKDDSSHLKVGFGPSYAHVRNLHLIEFNVGIVRCFFSDSNFPFSINGSASIQVAIKKEPANPYMDNIDGKYSRDFVPIIGYGYTQAFFAKNNVYPFIGISNGFSLDSNINVFSAIIGLNIKMD